MEMSMTHYMELLAQNQPWNLIIFMAIPVILVEWIAITELFILLDRNLDSGLRQSNKIASILVGFYFTGIFVYLLFNAAIPLTTSGQWRGWVDVLAVLSYMSGVVPLVGIALLDMGLLKRGEDEWARFRLHVIFVAIFLVVAHIAMVFGMLSPSVFSHHPMNHMGG